MTLNELFRWFQYDVAQALRDLFTSGYHNLFGSGDIGELTISQVLFTLFIGWMILETISDSFGNKD